MHQPVRDFWECRADDFVQSLRAVLDWVRDVKGVTLTPDDLREAASLRGVASMVRQRRLSLMHTGCSQTVDLGDVPDALVSPLARYLADTAGYDPSVPFDEQRSDEPWKQHGYVLLTARRSLPGVLA